MNAAHAADSFLRDGVIMLGAALAAVLIFRRLGLGATLGYLVAGAAIGPEGLRLVGDAQGKIGVAEIGITLLLFIVGLELHPSRLWRLRRDIFGLGALQVVLASTALGALLFFFTPFTGAAAIALGLPLALSSTAQVLPMLRSAGRLNTPFGERAFSILLLQDLSIVPLITIIASLSRAPIDHSAPPGWLLAIYTVAAIAGLVLVGRFILNPLFRLIGRIGEREMFVAAGLFTVLAAGAVMQALHLSTALGAFVAGVMLADSPYRHELEADIEPFRSILLGLFFVAVGMLLDLHAVAARPFFVLAMAATLVATKTIVLYLLARLFGMVNKQAIALGLLLSQGGEFGFVLFGQAQAAYLIAPEVASLMGAVVTLSMATTPFLMAIGRRLGGKEAGAALPHLDGPEEAAAASAIIVGYGRFGQTVAQLLFAQGASVTLIDSKPEQIETSSSFGMKVYYGDGTRVELLRQADADAARLILFCIDGGQPDGETLAEIAEAFPQATIFARVFDRRHMLQLEGTPIAGHVREVYESAVCMGRMALGALELDEEEVERLVREYRDRDAERFAAQADAGDLRARLDLMLRPGEAERKEA
ncbi:MAG: cation:proton antiporter [Sphingomonadaceae bacterium]|nr:cation:proton antiporter [Sphingomonadaceae bacterium]